MVATTVYFAGSEDESLYQVGGGTISTTTGTFRSGWQRCSLLTSSPTVGTTGSWWSNQVQFSASTFWFSARTFNSENDFGTNPLVQFWDTNGLLRLALVKTTGTTYGIFVYNSSGAPTQLGSNFTMITSAGVLDKLDIFFIGNATTGQVTVYLNGVQMFNFTGNTIQNGVTNLSGFNLLCENGTGLGGTRNWSEIMVISTDSRSAGLQVFPPLANGNTHNFDTGSPAASNVNEVPVNDSNWDGSSTAGQIDEYTTGPVVPGTFSVLAYGVAVRSQVGPSGPQHLEIGVRTHSTDEFTSPIAQTESWACYQNWWPTNPFTGVAWLTSEIGSTPGFNIGIQSAT